MIDDKGTRFHLRTFIFSTNIEGIHDLLGIGDTYYIGECLLSN